MTIRVSSFDTFMGRTLVIDKTIAAIKEAMVRDNLADYTLGYVKDKARCVFVTGQYSSESNIPYFFHPIILEDKHKSEIYVVSDIRPFVELPLYGSGSDEIKVKNKTEYDFHTRRAAFQLDWINGFNSLLKPSLPLAGAVFAGWISEAITKRYALDPKDRLDLMIIAHFYYQSLFYPESEFDEDIKQTFSVHTIKATKAPSSNMVFDIFDRIGRMDSLEDLCENIKNILSNVRLKDFSLPVLYTITGNAWYSVKSAETLAIALEHPPTWITIVMSALNDRTFRNSMIARIAEKTAKGSTLTDFTNTCNQILKDNRALSFEHVSEFPEFL